MSPSRRGCRNKQKKPPHLPVFLDESGVSNQIQINNKQQEEDPTIDPVLKNLDLMKEKETQDSGPSFYDFEDDYEGPENFSENVFSNLTSTTTEVPMKAKNLDLLGFSRKDIQVYKNKASRAEKDLEIRKKNDLEKIDVETAEF